MHTGTFSLASGQEVFTRAWKPDSASAAVLCLHGVESHSDWFDEVGASLSERGMATFGFDRPGWGKSAGERGHIASYADALGQVAELATSLRREYGVVHLAGLSWGGLLALYAALRRGPLFDSLTLIAPGIASKADLSWWRKLRVAWGVISGRPRIRVPLPIEVDHFTHRPDRTRYIREDPARVKSVTASFCLETLKMRRFAAENIACRRLPPTTLLLADSDRLIDNQATRELIRKASTRTAPGTVRIVEMERTAHSLVFEAPERVAEEIARLAVMSACPGEAAETEPSPDAEKTSAAKVVYALNAEIYGGPEAGRAKAPQAADHVLVMGAGAIGSLVGDFLRWAGNRQLSLVAKPMSGPSTTRACALESERVSAGSGRTFVR